jgi:uncharacterized protein (TIGR03545 family)
MSDGRVRIFRWKAIAPLMVFTVLGALFWWLFADTLAERGIEAAGTELMGARVDLASAHVAVGQVSLRGLEVTDPESPMTNFVEVDELVAQIAVLPLLEKKVVIDTIAVRGVRFGTPRQTSGALAEPSATSGPVRRQVADWARQVQVPPLSLEGLGRAVELPTLNRDSLRTLAAARAVDVGADSAKRAWDAEAQNLNPQPVVDSARALADRLRGASLASLGLSGARDAVRSVQRNLTQVRDAKNRVATFERNVTSGVDTLRRRVAALDRARDADYAWARGLVKLPSLDTPDLSASVMGDWALTRIQPALYWLSMAEKYLPPGLDPRRNTGPKRFRRSGTTVRFPREQEYPAFLVRFAEGTGELGGEGTAAGRYQARLTGLTSSPALYGRPTTVFAERSEARTGPHTFRLRAVLDHTRSILRDSIGARGEGVALPELSLPVYGANAALGEGTTEVRLQRTGDHIVGRWAWRAPAVRWTRTDTSEGGDAPMGSKPWLDALVWQSVSGLRALEVDAGLSGPIASPSLELRSNLGRAVAQSIRGAVGQQVARAEQQVRAEVDRVVRQPADAARAKVDGVTREAQGWAAERRRQLEQVERDLEARLRELARIPGVR